MKKASTKAKIGKKQSTHKKPAVQNITGLAALGEDINVLNGKITDLQGARDNQVFFAQVQAAMAAVTNRFAALQPG